MTPRETIYSALFALGQNASGFATTGRRLQHIQDLQPVQFPAFYQVQLSEDWTQVSNLPPLGTLRVEWWLYVQSSDPTASHAALLNPLIDALTSALQLPPHFQAGIAQSLSGLVTDVRLDGKIEVFEGVLEERAFARIPLVLKTPG